MSTPIDQQQPPPSMEITQQDYTAHTGHGSVGPVVAVLAVITILGVIAGMIGRLCSGRRIMDHGQYDFEGWVERKCSSCLDGRIDPPPSAVPADIPVAEPVEQVPQESKEEHEQQIQKQHKQKPQATASHDQS